MADDEAQTVEAREVVAEALYAFDGGREWERVIPIRRRERYLDRADVVLTALARAGPS